MKKEEKKHPSKFARLVSELKEQNISMNEIAQKIGLYKSGTTLGDNSVLTKLCNGSLKSFKKRTIEQLTNELLTHKDFAPILSGKRIEVSNFELLFFFYYWSPKYNEVRTGLLGIVKGKLSECRFYYLQKGIHELYVEKDTADLKSIVYENSETMDIVLSKKHIGTTYISAHLGNNEIDEIEVSFYSYCGAIGSTQKPYAGIGLLEKVEPSNFEKYMQNISSNGIPQQIINALYKRRFDLSKNEVEIYDSIESINITQKEPLKLVRGQWLGFFLRSQIEGPEESGGIVRVLMDVEESGIATIYFKESDNQDINDYIIYRGFFKFPISNSGAVTIGEFG